MRTPRRTSARCAGASFGHSHTASSHSFESTCASPLPHDTMRGGSQPAANAAAPTRSTLSGSATRAGYGDDRNSSVAPPSENRLPSRAWKRSLPASTEYARRLSRGDTPARSHGCSPSTRTPRPRWIRSADSAKNAFAAMRSTVSGTTRSRTPTPCTSLRANASAAMRTTGTPSTNAGSVTTKPSSLPTACAKRRRSNPESA